MKGNNPLWDEVVEEPAVAPHYTNTNINANANSQTAPTSSSTKPTKQRVRKQKRAIPNGVSKHDAKILRKARTKAHRLEWCFDICGLACGWSVVIGFLPVIGDFFNLWLALRLLRSCESIDGGLPANVRAKMMSHIVVDFFIGITPILGDIAGAIYKANSKNTLILENLLAQRGAANLVKTQRGSELYSDNSIQLV
ncbi:hypothetical protein NADFUDRAFT_55496 [Nadsonia fulvescens var. elongata DSM 6958]|uniref:DUF4112 domain-containing protein n=1 Tax=Nadsonia fulvescens var. elongata DSM 6958 TaxID=857566 RepID=A0A1E3PN96_9ASCO|nr:hypothetical protein NADFUDRAFT_55496 [Nadsonia fulvescens var. elongata DSM 6958]